MSHEALALVRAKLVALAAGAVLLLASALASAATLTVTGVADVVNGGDGVCTLREALVAANTNVASGGAAGECVAGQAAPTVDVIAFAIPGAGVHTIALSSALPAIVDPVVIDGYTQAGSAANTQASGGSNAVLRVEVNGTNAGLAPLLRFVAGSGGSEVRGLVLNRSAATAMHLGAAVRVAGNFIGTDASGVAARGNAFHGVEVAAAGPGLVGGTAAAERNVIAYGGGAGVLVNAGATGWRIAGNATFGNAGKGIALSPGALPLANDVGDADTGANERQNFPLLDSVTLTASTVRVQGRVVGAASRTLLLDVYGSRPLQRPGQFLEGEVVIGTAPAALVTDAQGKATFDVTLPYTTDANLQVTATLTDVTGCAVAGCGSTSEFAQRGVFRVAPRWGAAAGALAVTVAGQLFQPGSTFAFGATAANGPLLVDAQRLDGTLPVLQAGTLYDVTVSNPDTTTATMAKAFVTDFLDVAPGTTFYPFVMNIAANGITSGCAVGQYCPASVVARAQMAVFLMRGRYGPFFAPPAATGLFADVAVGSFAADWIEQLQRDGITTGCASGPLRYCPVDPVSRAQMAVFLLRIKYGAAYVPPPCTGVFADVACVVPKHPFADWIEQLYREQVTLGCASNPLRYCPEQSVLRQEMAAFLTRVLGLDESTNAAPVTSAGADATLVLPAVASLTGAVNDDGLPLPPGQLVIGWTKQSGPGTVTFADATSASTSATFSAGGSYVLRLTANDGALSAFDEVTVTVIGDGAPPPLNPPPIDPTVPTTIVDSTAFLYTGPNPVQTGVVPGTIVRQRAAVVRGKVLTRAGAPLSGVRITILNHPEFGQALSRSDGVFDMAVNGGGPLVVDYAAIGYLPMQRQVQVAWQSYAVAPDVVLTPLDAQVTTIAGNAGAVQVHQANPVTDSDGTRKAVLLFRAGTSALMVLPNGSTQPLASMNVRATEYTVGPQGPRAMPGALPPTSGYTYAVELSVDEALAAGATRVDFSQPVIKYVDNFLGFPVGMAVPTGYYDRAKAAWVAAPNGRVIRITGVTGGLADVDTVGTGSLPALVLANAERQQLAALYAAGQELWRVPISHFTPWDCNWPYGPPNDAIGPPADPPRTTASYDGSCEAGGSIIDCEGQTLGEALAIPGTGFALRYRSDRVPARVAALEIPVTGPAVPSSLIEARVSVEVAGTLQTQTFPPVPNQTTRIAWDGLDAYGRPVQGAQVARVKIDFVYAPVYLAPGSGGQSFALPGDGALGRARNEILVSMTHFVDLARADLRGLGLGGWALDVHHVYHPGEQSVQFGTGRVRRAKAIGRMITRVDFGGFVPANSTGGKTWTVGPDGSVYFVTSGGAQTTPQIRRRAPDGTVSVVAGNAQRGGVRPYGDGGPALAATVVGPGPIEIGPDGSLYFVDINVIRRVRPDGIIERFAGMRSGPDGGAGETCSGTIVDGVPATASPMCPQPDMAVAPDGSVYFAEHIPGRRVRRVGPDGIVTTVAGTGPFCSTLGFPTNPCGDGGPATQAQLFQPNGLALAPDGSLYVGDGSTVRRIGRDGIITRVAALSGGGFGGDGGPALNARFSGINDLVVEADGTIHLVDGGNNRIRTIDPKGIVRTIAGTGQQCLSGQDCNSGDGGPLGQARVWTAQAIKSAPDGSVYFVVQQSGVTRIRRIGAALPGIGDLDLLIPSPDGGEIHQFDRTGRHLRTRHPLTSAPLREFDYDAAGRLIRVREMTGAADNVTTIVHDAAGNPMEIVGPFGNRTTLTVNANGFLASFVNAGGNAHQFASTALGLLTSHTDPRGNTTTFTYDADGRLTLDAGPAGASQALARGELPNGFGVVRTTALGRATSYAVEAPTPGVERRTVIAADATTTVGERRADAATETITTADGVIVTQTSGADPRFGMQAPIVASWSSVTPGGRTLSWSAQRTATLSSPTDILSLDTLIDTVTVNGSTSTTTYTGSTRTLNRTTAAGRTSTDVLDPLGRIVSTQTGGLAPITYAYDSRGRLASMIEGSGAGSRAYTFAYSPQGFVQSVTDPLGRSVLYTRDANGRAIATTLPGGATVGMAYDAAGDIASITPPGKPAHTFAYNARGDLSSITPPVVTGSGPTTFSYDQDGQVTQITQPGGEAVAHAFDPTGRLSVRTLTNVGLPASTYTVSYDAAGRIATLNGPGAQAMSFTHDGGLVTGVTWSGPVSGSLTRTFDNNFRVANESVNGGSPIAFTYNADNRLTQAGGLAIGRIAQSGLIQSTTLGVIADTFTRNAFGELIAYSVQAGGSPLFGASFVRDAIGRITRKQETIAGVTDTYDYAYDAPGQLTSVTRNGSVVESYVYDANGNRVGTTLGGVMRSATYDVQDRLVNDGATTFTFTPAGWLTSKTVGAGTTAYQYDALGNLLRVSLPSGTVIDYQVDGLNRRIGKSVNGVPVQRFVHTGLLPVAEFDGAGTLVSRFVFAAGVAPAYMVKAGVTYRIVTDRNGSVRLVVDAATGAVVQRIDYDGFGKVTLDTSPGFQPFGFAGGLYDADTGLVRFGARDYDAESGRWTAKDPIGFGGRDSNLYRYVRNDPVNAVDPSGMAPIPTVRELTGVENPTLAQLEAALERYRQAGTLAAQERRPDRARRVEWIRLVRERLSEAIRLANRLATICVLIGQVWSAQANAQETGRSVAEQYHVERAAEGWDFVDQVRENFVDPVVDFFRGTFGELFVRRG